MPGYSARVAPLAVVFGVNGAVYGSLLPRYPEIADRVGASTGQFGVALAGIGVGGVTGALVATWVVRVFGGPVRALAVVGPAFLVAGVAVAGAADVPVLVVAFAALGLCDGFVDTAMNQAGGTLRARGGASVMGRLHATLAAATLTGTAVGVLVAGRVGVLLHLVVVAIVLLVALVVALRAMGLGAGVRTGRAAVVEAGSGRGVAVVHRVTQPRASASGGWWCRVRWWAVLVLAGLAAVLVELPAQEWSGLLLARELSSSATVAAAGPLAAVAGVLAGRLVLDRAVDALGWTTVARLAGGLTAAGTLAAVLLGALTRHPAPVLAGLGVAAVGAGAAAPLLFDRASSLAARVGLAPDSGAGLVSGVFRLGVLASPLLVGVIAEQADLFWALGLAAVAGLALVVLAGALTRDGTD